MTDETAAKQPDRKGARRPFNMVPRDLDLALTAAKLSSVERIIIHYIRAVAYLAAHLDKREVEPCAVNGSYLAREWGMPHPKFYTALRCLVADRVLVRTGTLYLINEDFRAWSPGRLKPEHIPFIGRGYEPQQPKEDKSSHRQRSGRRQKPATNCTPGGTDPAPQDAQTCTPEGTPTVPRRVHRLYPGGYTDCTPEGTPTVPQEVHLESSRIGTRASEDFKKTLREEDDREKTSAADILLDDDEPFLSRADAKELQPGERDQNGFPYRSPGQPILKLAGPQVDEFGRRLPWNDKAGFDRLVKWADGFWPKDGVGFKIEMFGKNNPPGRAQYWLIDIEQAALEVALRAAEGETIETPWKLLQSILWTWKTKDHEGDPGPWSAEVHVQTTRSKLDRLMKRNGKATPGREPGKPRDDLWASPPPVRRSS